MQARHPRDSSRPRMEMNKPRFGEQRLALPGVSAAERLLFHALGVADPLTICTDAIYCVRCAVARPGPAGNPRCRLRPRRPQLLSRSAFPDAQIYGIDLDEQRVERNRCMGAPAWPRQRHLPGR